MDHSRPPKLLYSIEEAAELAGLGLTRIFEEMRTGRLKAKKAGRRTLIPTQSLVDWIQSLQDR